MARPFPFSSRPSSLMTAPPWTQSVLLAHIASPHVLMTGYATMGVALDGDKLWLTTMNRISHIVPLLPSREVRAREHDGQFIVTLITGGITVMLASSTRALQAQWAAALAPKAIRKFNNTVIMRPYSSLY